MVNAGCEQKPILTVETFFVARVAPRLAVTGTQMLFAVQAVIRQACSIKQPLSPDYTKLLRTELPPA
jgi:hypothetical protein